VSALTVEGLSKSFGGESAVADVSLTLDGGEFFSLIGPSGCGKTTTLRMLGGLAAPDAGTVRIDGRDVTDLPARERATNMVFQDLVLFPHMTVAENIGYGLARTGVTDPERSRQVADALSLVGLEGFEDRDPASLSGGQQQRVALARALVNDPAVLLLDEPLASLDRALREEMQTEFRRIQRNSGTTFLYVTHDQESAMSMSDRIGVMQDGRVVDTGSPRRLYNQPRTRFVAEFLGDATVLAGTVTDRTADTVVIETAAGDITAETLDRQPATGEQVTVAVRPETVRLGDGPITGEVVDTAYKGFYAEATVDCGGPELVVRRQRRTAVADGGTGDTEGLFSVGETVRLRVERAVVVADGDG
jgi:spermidine/putrescine transport system ATP-binding protein